MRILVVLIALFPALASAQTYDLDLTLDGVKYAGDFTWTIGASGLGDFTNVSITGTNGVTLNVGEDLQQGIEGAPPGADGIWFLNSQDQTLGITLLDPLGGARVPFYSIYSNINGPQAHQYCDPGPDVCSGLVLKEVRHVSAPELDPAPLSGALTLLCGGVLVLRGRRSRASQLSGSSLFTS
jgi:hypothetical protein